MAKRTKAEALKTRQELIETAIAQFAQHGVSKTTLNDIADAANVTLSTGTSKTRLNCLMRCGCNSLHCGS